jgi:hypothetical protein
MLDRNSICAIALAALCVPMADARAQDATFPDLSGQWKRPPGVGIRDLLPERGGRPDARQEGPAATGFEVFQAQAVTAAVFCRMGRAFAKLIMRG